MADIHPNLLELELLSVRQVHRSVVASPDPAVEAFHEEFKVACRDWKTGTRCLWRGCPRVPPRKSHVVQEAALKGLDPDGKLVAPSYRSGAMGVAPAQPKSATVVVGYCDKHEARFDWESVTRLTTPRHRRLQALRSIDSECHELRRAIRLLEIFLSLVEVVQRDLRTASAPSARQALVHVSATAGGLRDQLESRRLLLSHLDEMGEELMTRGQRRRSSEPRSVHLDRVLPCALVGAVIMNEPPRRWVLSVTVIPSQTESLLLLKTRDADVDCLDRYQRKYLDGPDSAAGLVELWLLDGTFNWCASETWWNSLPPGRQGGVVTRVANTRAQQSAPRLHLW